MIEDYFLADDGAVIASKAPISSLLSDFLMTVPDKSNLLDIGAGTGRLGSYLQSVKPSIRVTGIEINESVVQEYRSRSPNTKYVLGDALDMPFDDNNFDAIVAYNSYHEVCSKGLTDDRTNTFTQAIREATRILKPDGRLFMFDGCLPIPPSTELILRVRSKQGKEISEIFQSGFGATNIKLSGSSAAGGVYKTDAHTVFALMTKYKYILQDKGWEGERSQLYTFMEYSKVKHIMQNEGLVDIESHFAPNEVPINFLKHFSAEYPSGELLSTDLLQQFRCATIARLQ